LLGSIYNLIKKGKRKPQDLMRNLSNDNKEFLQNKIKSYFEQGRNCPNIVQFTIKVLQDGNFSAKESGTPQKLIAFLHSMINPLHSFMVPGATCGSAKSH